MFEQVLVFDAPLIDRWKEDASTGVLTDRQALRRYADRLLCSGGLHFMDRGLAETDPGHKQVIPYAVIRQGGLYFRYRRTKKGGEKRLHDLWSLGVGGHINPVDGDPLDAFTYHRAFRREVREEVGLELPEGRQAFESVVAMIYDDSDEVGRVHFGVVHLLDLPLSARVETREGQLSQGQHSSLGVLRNDRNQFEGWSRLVIDHVLPGLPA